MVLVGGRDWRGVLLLGIAAGAALWVVVVVGGAAGRGKVWRAGPFKPVDWMGGVWPGG